MPQTTTHQLHLHCCYYHHEFAKDLRFIIMEKLSLFDLKLVLLLFFIFILLLKFVFLDSLELVLCFQVQCFFPRRQIWNFFDLFFMRLDWETWLCKIYWIIKRNIIDSWHCFCWRDSFSRLANGGNGTFVWFEKRNYFANYNF